MKVIHTADPQMKKMLEVAERVAASKAHVLITGESGTGKELLAHYIHSKSNRAGKDFVAVNCAAIPEGLLESELFGFEKGSFTGAHARKIGKFEQANGGTFLLDEVSELPLQLQSKLLRTIQENEVQRIGGAKPIPVDVRLIAATNQELFEAVKVGRFREDLFYRLNVIPLNIPPLRERPKDVEILAQIFLDICSQQNGVEHKKISAGALEKLKLWNWPGNVRELQNVIERSSLLSAQTEMSADEILIENYSPKNKQESFNVGMTVSEGERLLILKTLDHTSQNRTQAAHILGISIRTLRNKLNEYREEGSYEQTV